MKTWSVLLLFLVSSLGALVNGESGDLDKNRPSTVFDVNSARKGGHTYEDTLGLHAVSEVEVAGRHVKSIMDMSFTSEMKVTDRAEGGQEVDTTIENVRFDMTAMGQKLSCDSEHPMRRPECKPFLEVAGHSNHFIIDDDGNIAHQSGSVQQTSAVSTQISPEEQLQQTARLLKFVPGHPVKPGDTWDASIHLDDEMGTFTGTATLLGYQNVDGHDCAVIHSEGNLDVDIKRIAKKMGGRLPGIGDMSVGEIKLVSTVYWDNENGIARSSETWESLVIEMKSPLDNSVLTVPVEETITTRTEIKA